MIFMKEKILKGGFFFLSVLVYANPIIFPDIDEKYHAISLQGFTGLINTPNAQTLEEGELIFSWNNQFDEHLRGYDKSLPFHKSDDYIFGVGLLNNLEIQGRVKNQFSYIRDLSANIKYKLPKLWFWMPDFAIGIQDAGSKANYYENYYIVADKTIGPIRASIGYGSSHSSAKSQRMDGVFGGIEARILPWLSLLGEYDGKQKHIAARFQTGKIWCNRFNLTGMVSHNLDTKHNSIQFSISFYPEEFQSNYKEKVLIKKSNFDYTEYIKILENEGLTDLKLYKKEKNTLVIEYDNRVFRHNEKDAIFTIISYALHLKKKPKNLILITKKSGIEISSFKVSLKSFGNYLNDPSDITKKYDLKNSIDDISPPNKGTLLVEGSQKEKFKLHLEFSPVLKTMVATEVGLLDYQLLLGSTARINLFKGIDFTARYDFHIDHSDEFDPDKLGVFSYLYNKGGLSSIMLHYTQNLNGFINTISSGLYKYEYIGVVDQLSYVYENNLFGLKLGYFKHFGDYEHPDTQENKKFFLAKYTYSYQPLDLQLSFQAGQYWKQDRGFDIELKKFFGDIAISIKYLQTSPKNKKSFFWAESSNKYVGLYLEMPLDFRKSKTNGRYFQLQGNNAWSHGLRTTVARKDGTNKITPGNGEEPIFDLEHKKDFFNRNRVGANYLKENLDLF